MSNRIIFSSWDVRTIEGALRLYEDNRINRNMGDSWRKQISQLIDRIKDVQQITICAENVEE